MTFKRLVIATHNNGKLNEYRGVFEPYGVAVSSAGEWKLSEPDETGASFRENASIKACYAAVETNIPALGDDGGLVIPALDGHPGIRSSRWAEESGGFEKAHLLLEEMLANKSHEAYFEIALALHDPDTQQTKFFEGKCPGTLSFPARGKDGFGYDPIFVPKGHDKSFAQLGIEVKKKISHRARALSSLINTLFNVQ